MIELQSVHGFNNSIRSLRLLFGKVELDNLQEIYLYNNKINDIS